MARVSERKGTRAWIELNMNAMRNNLNLLRECLPRNCELMPAVKANAYGHGAVLIAEELAAQGICHYCVATIQEGILLREAGIKGEIVILGYTSPEDSDILSQFSLTQSILDYPYAIQLNMKAKQSVMVHLAVDSGMHRVGIPHERIADMYEILKMDNLIVTGAYTHLCVADSANTADVRFSEKQAASFKKTMDALREKGFYLRYHILNSSGIIQFPQFGGTYARPGIALYGLGSSRKDVIFCKSGLQPVLSLKARIVHMTEVAPGDGYGYGLEGREQRKRRIAVLPVGYADGVPRTLSCGVGSVLIRGQRTSIAGRICMDQMLIDVTDIPDAVPGDTAVIIGKSGDLEISAYDIAEATGTITNDVLSGLGGRLDRIKASG